MSATDPSLMYSHESLGIAISCPPKFNHVYNAKKHRSVVRSLGLEKYHGLLLFFG